ncbi:hypothetical protein F5X99DRAFT_388706 [Biscogniauxia marginata]|nr:hypothetical protein F5X99DRAFT_388706 [Biscogniauxia marginata]
MPVYQPPKRISTAPEPHQYLIPHPIQQPPQQLTQTTPAASTTNQAHAQMPKGMRLKTAVQRLSPAAPIPVTTHGFRDYWKKNPKGRKPQHHRREGHAGAGAIASARLNEDDGESKPKSFDVIVDKEEMERDAQRYGLTVGLKHSRWAPKEMQEEAKREIEAARLKQAAHAKEVEKQTVLKPSEELMLAEEPKQAEELKHVEQPKQVEEVEEQKETGEPKKAEVLKEDEDLIEFDDDEDLIEL